MVRLLYAGAVSRVMVNGHLSQPIEQQRGVRQGCPLSPMLYVLYLEPLVGSLGWEPAFQGMHVPDAGGGPGQGVSLCR